MTQTAAKRANLLPSFILGLVIWIRASTHVGDMVDTSGIRRMPLNVVAVAGGGGRNWR